VIKINKKHVKRNVTLSLSNSLLQKAKLTAVREDKSLSQFMKEALEEKIRKNSGYRSAKQRQLKLLDTKIDLGTKGQFTVSREELHERE